MIGNAMGVAEARLESQSPTPPLEVIAQSPPAVGSGAGPENRTWTCCAPGRQNCCWHCGLIWSEKAYAGRLPMVKLVGADGHGRP